MAPLPQLLLAAAILPLVALAQLPPLLYIPLPYGAVRPEGWLARELRIQAAGLSSAMPVFYSPIVDSQWLGGNSTYDMWVDNYVYWLQGFLPQAIQQNDSAQLRLVQTHIDYILAHAEPNGWLGPQPPNPAGRLYWPRYPMLMAFFAWWEYGVAVNGTGDARLITASLAWLHLSRELMRTIPFGESGIGDSRWQDLLQPPAWLLDNVPSLPDEERTFLMELSTEIYRQGVAVVDWERKW